MLTVSIVQTHLHWENIDANLDHFTTLLAEIPEHSNLIVLPEMFTTGFTMNTATLAEENGSKALQWMQQQATKLNATISGSVMIKENNTAVNRLFWVPPNGDFLQYDKRHLFRMAGENNFYNAGNNAIVATLNNWKIKPLICYDLRFPVWSRNSIRQNENGNHYDYDVLIYVANWPEKRNHAWKSLLVARAIENQCYVVAVNRIGNDGNGINYSGDSVIINPLGEIISHVNPNLEAIETITLSMDELSSYRKSFPALLDADNFKLL